MLFFFQIPFKENFIRIHSSVYVSNLIIVGSLKILLKSAEEFSDKKFFFSNSLLNASKESVCCWLTIVHS